ncbi:hypothetical protein E2C01_087789 [Portunus trituberculatus]|uniref:Uncharacterized protein n=1 Tax=Portunus trituberculatus TaxID=210409 RepID=A0A5B7JDG2_PORTR|nr:hypothetical protein [Portunus trituberculatus]
MPPETCHARHLHTCGGRVIEEFSHEPDYSDACRIRERVAASSATRPNAQAAHQLHGVARRPAKHLTPPSRSVALFSPRHEQQWQEFRNPQPVTSSVQATRLHEYHNLINVLLPCASRFCLASFPQPHLQRQSCAAHSLADFKYTSSLSTQQDISGLRRRYHVILHFLVHIHCPAPNLDTRPRQVSFS